MAITVHPNTIKRAKRLSNEGLETVVSVNGIEIPADKINIESGNYDGGTIKSRQYQAAVALVVQELLRQRAEELDIQNPDPEARAEAVIAHDVTVPKADAEYCRNYYEKNKQRFYTEPLLEARHILLAAAPDDLDLLNKQRTVAEELIEQLQNEPEQFAHLAKQYSECPSAEQGGHLGQIARGQTVPEFEDKVMGLQIGLATRPIETRYGWHVVEILQRVDGELLSYESVKEKVAIYLHERSKHRAFRQYVRLLVSDADIKGIALEESDSPLVQ